MSKTTKYTEEIHTAVLLRLEKCKKYCPQLNIPHVSWMTFRDICDLKKNCWFACKSGHVSWVGSLQPTAETCAKCPKAPTNLPEIFKKLQIKSL